MLSTPIRLKKLGKGANIPESEKQSADVYFYIGQQIIPARRHLLVKQLDIGGEGQESNKISKQLNSNRIILISQPINIVMFQKIILFLQSFAPQLNIINLEQLEDCITILHMLSAKQYIQQISNFLQVRIHQFDIFCLLSPHKFKFQKIFELCFQYLELDQFQQIKYNKFDFLQCDFQLFQIVLRRHHVLKPRDQIQGLDKSDIQEIIRTYCIRNHFGQQILKRLLNKYVLGSQNIEKKTTLKLDGFVRNNILQSANIGTDVDYDQIQDIKELWKNPSMKFHKYSLEMRQQQRLIAESKFRDSFFEKFKQPQVQSIFRQSSKKSSLQNEYQLKFNGIEKQQKIEWGSIKSKQAERSTQQKQYQNSPEAIITSKLQGILTQHESSLNQHNLKYRQMRRNSKSVLFQDLEDYNQILYKAKLINSSNLVGFNPLFAIFDTKKQI